MRLAVVILVVLAACGSGKKRQTRSSDAAAVEPITLPGDSKPGAADEAEPNDNDDSAMPLTLGATIHGRIEPITDADFYRIDIPSAGALAVQLTAVEQIDLTLEIHDASGNVLGKSDRGGVNVKEGVPNLGVQAGRYTAVVRMKKPVVKGKQPKKAPPPPPSLPYDISAQLGAPAKNAEREPDDDRGTANDLILNDPVTGYIGWSDDVDVWKLSIETLSAKNVIDIEIAPVEATAFTLELADGVGSSLLVRKAPKGAGLVVKGLAPKVAEGAPPYHYITIKATPSNPESPYALRVTAGTPELDAEAEPNDTIEKPMPFPAERTVVDGWWSPGDIDCYALPPDPAQRMLQVDVEVPTDADLSAELLVDGKSVGKSDAKGKGTAERVIGPVPPNAKVVLRIRGADSGAQGAYRVKLGEAP